MTRGFGVNISALKGTRALSNSSRAQEVAMRQLGSGMRINQASDDAAGLSIADSLKADTRIYTQGIRNVADSISLLNIASGALSALLDITLRQKELAEQAANGTYTARQRLAMDKELKSLTNESNRIIDTSTFNGVKVLDASTGTLNIQAGYGTSGILSIGIASQLSRTVGTGAFGAPIGTVAVAGFAIETALTDLNNDGKLDMLTTAPVSNAVRVNLGNGDGTFGSQVSYTMSGARYIEIGDVNNDGFEDMVTSSDTATSVVSIRLGQAGGTFGAATTYTMGNTVTDLSLTDINDDGVLDVLTADTNDNAFSVRLGTGGGTFGAQTTYAMGTALRSIALGDINQDGLMDVIGTDYFGDTLSIRLGVSGGNFGTRSTIALGAASGPIEINLADFNNDGNLDIAIAQFIPDSIGIFMGNGDGTFGARTGYATGAAGNPTSLLTDDINGDGLADIVVTESNSSGVGVFLNRGDGIFGNRTYVATGTGPGYSALGDLTGDGVKDLLTVNSSLTNVAIMVGASTRSSTIAHMSITTKDEALQTLDKLSENLTRIGLEQGAIGSFQSRMNTVVQTMSSTVLNYDAARSRIVDADVAETSASYIKNQILQEVASKVIGQAKIEQQLLLKLLG
jgi:flagellin-like hook-associated protein FlgL